MPLLPAVWTLGRVLTYAETNALARQYRVLCPISRVRLSNPDPLALDNSQVCLSLPTIPIASGSLRIRRQSLSLFLPLALPALTFADTDEHNERQLRLPKADDPYQNGLQVPSRRLFTDGSCFPHGQELYSITKKEWKQMVRNFNHHIDPHRMVLHRYVRVGLLACCHCKFYLPLPL